MLHIVLAELDALMRKGVHGWSAELRHGVWAQLCLTEGCISRAPVVNEDEGDVRRRYSGPGGSLDPWAGHGGHRNQTCTFLEGVTKKV